MEDTEYFGVSLSVKTCRGWGVDDIAALQYAVNKLGITHFRLMSYWNEIEKEQGMYDFSYLDKQFAYVEKVGGKVSLAVGKRQPRWPECHVPDWALALPKEQWYEALYNFIAAVVNRYKNSPALLSYQLENEALLKDFGICKDGDYSHKRLKNELKLIKMLDAQHPVIMSLSNNWGLPIRGPLPDIFAISLYRIMYVNGKYTHSPFPLWWYKLRATIIKLITNRSTFIHELQTEPWGPKANNEMTEREQEQSMSTKQLAFNINFAKKTGLYPIYMWGLEWWYYLDMIESRNVGKVIKPLIS